MLTSEQINSCYDKIIAQCRQVFAGKGMEYGPVWAVYRWNSLNDQLWMKIKRVRQLEQREGKIVDSIESEYMALINYALIFLMRLQNAGKIAHSDAIVEDVRLLDKMDAATLTGLYTDAAQRAFELYLKKNHDYNNAWQDMDVRSLTDLIIIKVLRLRHILASKPEPQAEDLDEQLYDIINYSVFALIKLCE